MTFRHALGDMQEVNSVREFTAASRRNTPNTHNTAINRRLEDNRPYAQILIDLALPLEKKI